MALFPRYVIVFHRENGEFLPLNYSSPFLSPPAFLAREGSIIAGEYQSKWAKFVASFIVAVMDIVMGYFYVSALLRISISFTFCLVIF